MNEEKDEEDKKEDEGTCDISEVLLNSTKVVNNSYSMIIFISIGHK